VGEVPVDTAGERRGPGGKISPHQVRTLCGMVAAPRAERAFPRLGYRSWDVVAGFFNGLESGSARGGRADRLVAAGRPEAQPDRGGGHLLLVGRREAPSRQTAGGSAPSRVIMGRMAAPAAAAH
jgi:hypothetical protein